MRQAYFSPSSRRDLQEILEYIAMDKPSAAVQFVDRIQETCTMLAKQPGAGTSRDDLLAGLRCWSVGNYVLYYRPAVDGIEVVRVIHGARDDGSIFKR